MNLEQQIVSLAAQVEALKEKVDKAAPENNPTPDLRTRLSAEREMRKNALDAKKFANPRRGVSVTSDRREEQIVRTNTKLVTPIIPRPIAPAVAPDAAGGSSVDFYCWQGGVLGSIRIKTGGVFTAI